MKINSFKDLIVWQKAISLTEEIYELTKGFPKTEAYGLSSQMQRAAVSIASNIAEGHKRKYLLEYIQFLSFANGSAGELQTQIEICKKLPELRHLDFRKAENLLEEILKMLNVLIRKLKTKTYNLSPNT